MVKKFERGYEFKEGIIILNKDMTGIDIFLRDFLKILVKHSDYLVVSGFVSIVSGRTRGTEDIDIIFPKMEKGKFKLLFEELIKGKFWCYQGDGWEEAYSYIVDLKSIRFARVGEMFPNVEFIPFDDSKKAKKFEFEHPQLMRIGDFDFKVPPIEFEILYKEIVLAGDKDIADALHLRTFFSEIIKKDRFKKYEPIIRGELK